MGDSFVTLNLTVAYVNYAMSVERDVVLVSNQNDGVAFVVEPPEQRHNLDSCRGIEVAGGLVGQQD